MLNMWVFDLILFLFWMAASSSPTAAVMYELMVENGATCYYAVGEPEGPPPPCPYLPQTAQGNKYHDTHKRAR